MSSAQRSCPRTVICSAVDVAIAVKLLSCLPIRMGWLPSRSPDSYSRRLHPVHPDDTGPGSPERTLPRAHLLFVEAARGVANRAARRPSIAPLDGALDSGG